ncbi:hypothetical protein E2C01_042708 [Portunus trituberculatus]|uniref:Uncharacterized protein n=1 Tax=Portunus trituberculatus TaxID=210409 RepID=A0A5B7FQX6_PORTR|nr:hypothetical protein [Portunus trituberculatus]
MSRWPWQCALLQVKAAGPYRFVVPGKWLVRVGTNTSVLSRLPVKGTLPVISLSVDEVDCDALVDTGYTKCVVFTMLCSSWKKERASVTVGVIVVPCKLLNVSFIMGINGIEALGDVTVWLSRFGIEDIALAAADSDKMDFTVTCNRYGSAVEVQGLPDC